MRNTNKKYVLLFTSIAAFAIVGTLFAKKIVAHTEKVQVENPKEKFTEADVKELSNVFNRIDTMKNMLIDGSYELYDNETKKLMEVEPFTLAKYNGDTYMMVGPIEEFFKGKRLTMIDNSLKTITVQDSVMVDTTASIMRGFSEMRELINDHNQLGISINIAGGNKIVKFTGDSAQLYKTSEIIYEIATGKLKSASIITSVIVPNNEENSEKKVLLKMVLNQYEDHPQNGKHIQLNKKIQWVNNRLELTDSLKEYQINYNK